MAGFVRVNLRGWAAMERYRNPSGTSGIRGYEFGADYIRIWWDEKKPFLYTYETVGREHVEAMKLLAKRGSHLNAYINRHPEVRNGFVRD
ncbi:MAG TPA: hypothetical protein VIM62_02830 [Acidobacteriaceae bacterium]